MNDLIRAGALLINEEEGGDKLPGGVEEDADEENILTGGENDEDEGSCDWEN